MLSTFYIIMYSIKLDYNNIDILLKFCPFITESWREWSTRQEGN